ncbi:hypothetical protein IV203_021463 [Nitzschia inconspicua]|uniref:Uncharacterized protein n=1 Tax=Nitzschia inconspicua TaxID=303405 RepID=A0A9K3KIM2_9STRA|nr:hypothetical protein IV203_021463 [Nitzschia inconspicua]
MFSFVNAGPFNMLLSMRLRRCLPIFIVDNSNEKDKKFMPRNEVSLPYLGILKCKGHHCNGATGSSHWRGSALADRIQRSFEVMVRPLKEQRDQSEDTVAILQADKKEMAAMKTLLAKLELENAALKEKHNQAHPVVE